jgi:hypothetical protein
MLMLLCPWFTDIPSTWEEKSSRRHMPGDIVVSLVAISDGLVQKLKASAPDVFI